MNDETISVTPSQTDVLQATVDEAHPPKYRILGAEEIWAPIPEARTLVKGLFAPGKLALIAAYGASFKSWICVDACIAIATRSKFLGFIDIEGQGDVLYWDYEMGNEEVRRRFQLCARGRRLLGPVSGVSVVTMPNLFLSDSTFEEEFLKICEGKKFVVIDTLAVGVQDIDENSADIARPLQALKRIADKLDCAIVVIHHSRKSGKDSDKRETIRGSSAIFNAVDTALTMTAKGSNSFEVSVLKQRCGAKIDPFLVTIRDVKNAVVLKGKPVPNDNDKSSKLESQILAKIQAKELRSKNEVQDAVGKNRKNVQAAVDKLLKEGKIAQRADGVFIVCPTVPADPNEEPPPEPVPSSSDAENEGGLNE